MNYTGMVKVLKYKIRPFFILLYIFFFLGAGTSSSNSGMEDSGQKLYLNRTKCEQILDYYGININIRSTAGWKRVVKNNNTTLYINRNSNQKKYINDLEQCLVQADQLTTINYNRGDQQ